LRQFSHDTVSRLAGKRGTINCSLDHMEDGDGGIGDISI
jgi:hypothetical protein